MLNDEVVKKAMGDGVVFTCAMCVKFWKGLQSKSNQCLLDGGREKCCGPLGGGDYSGYAGPIKSNMISFCFVCGDRSDAAVSSAGRKQVGVCKAHIHVLKEYSLPSKPPPFITNEHANIVEG